MSTLSKRGDKHVQALLRVVQGQIKAAMRDHPEWNLPETAQRSIAKRVTGDVAANWSRLSGLRHLQAETTASGIPDAVGDAR